MALHDGRTTLQDVARLAGVSPKTVARVINREANVSQQTRERVAEAATALRFRPNQLARDLRRGGRSAVGLVVGGLDNPFYSRVAAGVDLAIREHDLALIIASTDDSPEREGEVVQAMLDRQLAALLLVPAGDDHSYLDHERRRGLPVVLLDRPSTSVAADSVLWDNDTSVREAVDELVRRGHRRIAAVADRLELSTARERLAAFRSAVHRAGGVIDEALVRSGVHDASAARAVTRDLLQGDDPPTAIVSLNNRISVGVVTSLLQMSSDCAVVGFDEFDLGEALGITVIANDPVEMGRRGGERALHAMTDPTAPPERILLPTSLVRRGSGERGPIAG